MSAAAAGLVLAAYALGFYVGTTRDTRRRRRRLRRALVGMRLDAALDALGDWGRRELERLSRRGGPASW